MSDSMGQNNRVNSAAPAQHAPARGASSITLRVLQVFWKAFWSLLLILMITGVICAFAVFSYLYSIRNTSINVDLNSITLNQTSYVYKQNKNGEWVEAAQFHGEENREWVDLDRIPENLINAFISTEDKRFQTHKGVDWIRTGFAVLNTFTNQSSTKQGGSTLTQQLIKNLTSEDDVSITRKLTEIFKALNLEKKYSKDQILEAYLNLINLGNGAYGVQSAAQTYFSKDVEDLTLMECAAIAGITQNPSMYNPIYYPNNNTKRRNDVLYNLYNQGLISKEEYLTCKYTKLPINPGSSATSAMAVVDWYTDMVREDVVEDLVASGYSKEAARSLLYQGGLKIYSAVDTELQAICEKHYITNAKSLISSLPTLQSGIFCMDYEGRILATVGRRGEKTGNLLNSLATSAKRQPGSSIKPLTVYSPAIEYNVLDWSSIVPDEPIIFNGRKYPRNSYGFYYGDVTLQFALEVSANAVSVQVLNGILGLEKAFDFATTRYNLEDSLYRVYQHENGKTDTDVTLSSMATGGTLIGVTVQDMTEAYSVYGSGGKLYDSYSYYYVEDVDGNIILDNRDPLYEQALTEATAGVMNKMLQAVVQNKGGAANAARNARIGDWEIFGKTGTTNDFKDRWFVAGNPYCVAGIWCGYEFVSKYISGSHHSVLIWKRIMSEYLANKEKITFETSDKIVQRWYCTKTGKFATTACPNAKQGWYKLDSNLGVCHEHNGEVIRAGDTWVKPVEKPVEPPVTSTPEENTSSNPSSGTSSNPSSQPGTTTSTPSSQPVTSEPVTSEPVSSEPVSSKPVSSEPASSRGSKPDSSEPGENRPGTASSKAQQTGGPTRPGETSSR